METLWFTIVAFMLAMYVVLDGFDLGAGIIHLFVAKKDEERRVILNSIGPVWDGNEVWLLAAGGTLYFAFPKLYAASFSGFYLPLIMVLWFFMFRALGIELRHHVESDLWKKFWDASFSISSMLLAIFFGAALGNVIRGVPINETGTFFLPLWTDFFTTPTQGILDWYTVLFGLLSFSILTLHGANFISLKTTGELQTKTRKAGTIFWWIVLFLSIFSIYFTFEIKNNLFNDLKGNLVVEILYSIAIVSLGLIKIFQFKEKDLAAFISSSIYIFSMLLVTAFGLYPVVLPSTIDKKFSLTIFNTATSNYGLTIGIAWWIFGIILCAIYFVFLFYRVKGKTILSDDGY